jgi:hypothetical protein
MNLFAAFAAKPLLWACVALSVVLAGMSVYAYTQRQIAERRRAEAALSAQQLDVAKAANESSTAMITRLVKERDELLLKRAAENEAAEQAVAESRQVAVTVYEQLVEAKRQINAMTLNAGCAPVLAAQICPEVVDELRSTP